METKLVLFIILCTLFITSCFIQSNISAQSSVVNNNLFGNSTQQSATKETQPFLGINMRGYYTSMPQLRDGFKSPFPNNYYESSFDIISKTHAIDHLRYRFYWESYVRNSTAFMNEIEQVANTADKYGIKIVYDNHQFHTSSWLNVERGTGFPIYLFNDSLLYEHDSGGAPKSATAKTWWTNWWNNAIRVNGTDGWTLQLDFLKKIVSTVDKHPSTLGYEILSEPQVHNVDQWSKIGKYNTFITKELRKITSKTIIYSMNIPIDLKSEIMVNAENLAKMSPQNKENVVFKFSLYGIPSDGYQKEKLQLFENASRIAGVPLYVGEWNNIKRVQTYNDKGDKVWEIDPTQSDMSQAEANTIVGNFKHIGIWGLAFWEWSFMPNNTPNFNLVNVTYNNATGEGNIQPTKYYEIVKNAYEQLYGQPSERVFPTASKLTAPQLQSNNVYSFYILLLVILQDGSQLRTIFAYNEHEVKTDGSIDDLGSGYNVQIDLIDPDHDELLELAHKFSLDAEAIETYFNKSKKPEIRLLDNQTFTVVLDMKNKDPKTLETEGIYFFLGRKWLITIHPTEVNLQSQLRDFSK